MAAQDALDGRLHRVQALAVVTEEHNGQCRDIPRAFSDHVVEHPEGARRVACHEDTLATGKRVTDQIHNCVRLPSAGWPLH